MLGNKLSLIVLEKEVRHPYPKRSLPRNAKVLTDLLFNGRVENYLLKIDIPSREAFVFNRSYPTEFGKAVAVLTSG